MPASNGVVTNYYSGQGIVLMAQRDANGNPQGFLPIGNVSDLKISVDTTVLEHQESTTGSRGIDLRLTQQVKAGVSMVMESFNPDNLALGLYGTTGDQVATVATVETIVVPTGTMARAANTTFALQHIGLSNVTVSGSVLAAPTLGTDYTINPEVGSINIISTANGGGFSDGETITVTYDSAAYSTVDALTVSQPERWLRFEGLNTANAASSAVVVDVFRFATDPLQELALITTDVGQITLSGSALLDPLRPSGSKYFRQKLV